MKQVLSFCLLFLSAYALINGVAHGQSDDQSFELIEDMNGNVLISDVDVFEILSRTSLMLTSVQKPQIESAKQVALELLAQRDSLMELQENAGFAEALETREFALDAIMYLGPETWTIWINGEAFKPDRVPEDVRIVSVTPGSADIVWFADPGNPSDVREFRLLPGQAYIADTGTIIEASQRRSVAPVIEDVDEDADEEAARNDEAASDAGDGNAPQDLDFSAEQAEQLQDLQEALGLIPEGILPDEQAAQIDALQESLDAGEGGGLTDEQIEQLEAIQSLIGGGG